MEKKYSVNMENDQIVSVEVDGIKFSDPNDIPDLQDRAQVLRLMTMSGRRDLRANDLVNTFDHDFRELEHTSNRFPNMIISVFLIIALIMLAIAIISGVSTSREIAGELSAEGRVIDMVSQKSWDSDTQTYDTYYYPVVEFTSSNGTQQRIQLSEGSWPPAYSKGETVTVLYDSANPTHARIDSLSSTILQWLVPAVTGLVGMVFLVVAIFTYRFLKPDV